MKRAVLYILLFIITVSLAFYAFLTLRSSDEPVTASDLSSASSSRQRIEELFTPEELAAWDLYWSIDSDGSHRQEAINAVASKTGKPAQEAEHYMEFLLRRAQGNLITPSADTFRNCILVPAVSFHPGTAGSSLSRARAASEMLAAVVDNHLRFVGQERMDQMTEDAYVLLSAEERVYLSENLPGLVELIDATFSDYPAVQGLYEDAGIASRVTVEIRSEGAWEDWSRVRASLAKLFENAF